MKFLNSVYQYINILSLDVVVGAVISALFFARLLDVSVEVATLAALALTVWAIYTIDHLRDARAIRTIASTDRHRFHQKYFRAIFLIVGAVMVMDFILILYLPAAVFRAGLMLAFIVLIYLALQRYLKFLKEFFVAILYTAGVLLPSLTIREFHVLPIHFLIFGKFFITALMNLLLFSLFDYKEDRHQQQHSFVTWFGPDSTRYGIISLGLINILTGFRVWRFDSSVAIIFISMNVILLALLHFRRELVLNNYYRIVGDAVFFIPVLYLL
jgi:hypothetical protein